MKTESSQADLRREQTIQALCHMNPVDVHIFCSQAKKIIAYVTDQQDELIELYQQRGKQIFHRMECGRVFARVRTVLGQLVSYMERSLSHPSGQAGLYAALQEVTPGEIDDSFFLEHVLSSPIGEEAGRKMFEILRAFISIPMDRPDRKKGFDPPRFF